MYIRYNFTVVVSGVNPKPEQPVNHRAESSKKDEDFAKQLWWSNEFNAHIGRYKSQTGI